MFWEMLIAIVVSFILGAASMALTAFFLVLKKDLKIKFDDGKKSSNEDAIEKLNDRINDLRAGIEKTKNSEKTEE